MVKFVSASCPNCGAKLEIADNETTTKCEYCGKKIVLDDNRVKTEIAGKVSIEGIQSDKELIKNANELVKMGEYIKAKKLFEEFSLKNPDKYQGWLGLLICRTRNFTIKDNNILFENDINKYYNFFNKTAPDDVKEELFEKIDMYMHPEKYVIDNQPKKNKEDKKEKESVIDVKEIITLVVTIFFGMFGIHRFMNKDIKWGLIYLFTMGLFGIGWLYDIVKCIYNMVKKTINQQARE